MDEPGSREPTSHKSPWPPGRGPGGTFGSEAVLGAQVHSQAQNSRFAETSNCMRLKKKHKKPARESACHPSHCNQNGGRSFGA